MRVSSAQIFQQSVEAMLERQRELSETELQVASGKRILRPSDDPSGSVRILDLNEAQKRLDQYQRNADAAIARLDQEETALISIENLMQRVRELAVQAANDTLSNNDRAAIAAEVREHIDSFLQLANSRDANGEYIFAGFQSQTRPMSHDGTGTFSYNGDTGQRSLQIGETREVAIGDPGTIFMDFSAAAGGTTNIGEVFYDLATALESGSGYPDAITDIDTAFSRLFDTRAKIGARMNAIDDQKGSNEAFVLAAAQVRSTLEDLDYAEAISRFNQQLTAWRVPDNELTATAAVTPRRRCSWPTRASRCASGCSSRAATTATRSSPCTATCGRGIPSTSTRPRSTRSMTRPSGTASSRATARPTTSTWCRSTAPAGTSGPPGTTCSVT